MLRPYKGELTMLDSRGGGGDGGGGYGGGSSSGGGYDDRGYDDRGGPSGGSSPSRDLDDEIPF